MGIENINLNIKQFDKYFGSGLTDRLKETPVILDLFHNYIEQTYRTNKLYQKALNKILEIEDELNNSFSDKQKKLINKWEYYKDKLNNYISENAFIYGYCLDKELYNEKRVYKEVK